MSEMTIQNAVEAFNASTPKLAKDLTKREYFSGLAMQAFLSANPNATATEPQRQMDDVTRTSVRVADALLAELAKEKHAS